MRENTIHTVKTSTGDPALDAVREAQHELKAAREALAVAEHGVPDREHRTEGRVAYKGLDGRLVLYVSLAPNANRRAVRRMPVSVWVECPLADAEVEAEPA